MSSAISKHGSLRCFVRIGLEDHAAKTNRGEVGANNNQASMIESHEARIGQDGVPNVAKGGVGFVRPDRCNILGVVEFRSNRSEGRNPQFKMMNIQVLELREPNKFCHILNDFWLRPSGEKFML